MNNVLKDFKLEKKVSEEIINKYKNKVPEQVLDIWQNYGFGSFLNGYLKIVNPEEYEELLKTEDLKWDPYLEAREKYGEPAYDECFGYVPLLGLGGKDTVDNLKKVKLKEHIYIINDLVGPVEEME